MANESLLTQFQSFLDTETHGLSDSEYLDLLYEIIDECKSRINAKEEEGEEE